MRSELARQLVAEAMGWADNPAGVGFELSREMNYLERMASYKYDTYQQFEPGRRFMESLLAWLRMMKKEDREVAYRFVRDRLIFLSSTEIAHFVDMAYHDGFLPELLRDDARKHGLDHASWLRHSKSNEFRERQRRVLYFGLSDGAHTDVFRRCSGIENDQIATTFEVHEKRWGEMQKALATSLRAIGRDGGDNPKFNTIVLLDDFAASGYTYISKEAEGWRGKIQNFHRRMRDEELSKIVDLTGGFVTVLLYVASRTAMQRVREQAAQLVEEDGSGIDYRVMCVQPLEESAKVDSQKADQALSPLIEAYYDHKALWSRSLERGGTADARLGFRACALPVVLYHNAPNNSIALLWSYDDSMFPGLFPRVTRHWDVK